jgi:phospholipase D1/2
VVRVLLDVLGAPTPNPTQLRAARIPAGLYPQRAQPAGGSCWVQVLRSASINMLRQENAARSGANASVTQAQNNCLKAMCKAIDSARHFIYIEGQFYQTEHGEFGTAGPANSGPLAMLMRLPQTPDYVRFMKMLNIEGAPVEQILPRLRWAKVDDVLKEARGPQFMHDLYGVLGNSVTVEAMRLLGKPQNKLRNPIGRALIRAVQRAIDDKKPFHIYLVLPVHPEGPLNSMTLMGQIHLTMHSLVFGEHSLVNGIRRAILAARLRNEQKLGVQEARRRAAAMDTKELADLLPTEWQDYLTLLNLRNWATLDG